MGKRIELSKRLRLVASFVEPGAAAADVGTDHGYVPIWLVQEGVAAVCIAMDVNPGPLERAREHIAACGLTDRIQTRLSDGLSALSGEEVDTVIIAGMGGPLMVRILTEGLETARRMKRLILSPQSEIWSVRAFLERNGFVIEDEAMTEEDGKYYTVICARSAGGYIGDGTFCVSERKRLEWKYGKCLLERKDPVLTEFLKKEREKYRQVLNRLDCVDYENAGHKNGGDSPGRQARKNEVEEELALIERAFLMMGKKY